MIDQFDAYKTKFSDKDYYVKIAFLNSEKQGIVLNKSTLQYLEIVDSIFNPFHDGMMIISNDFNFIERGATPFAFLGNGRDVMFLDIRPENASVDFVLSFQFVIIECTEVMFQNAICKKLKFVEYGQYMLNETACNIFDIRTNTQGTGSFLQTNTASAISTGTLIRKILNKVFGAPGDDYSLFLQDNKTGLPSFDEDGCLDVGIAPYGPMNCGQILDYALKMHVHQDSPCILGHDRTTHKFQLISLRRLFEHHEQYTAECFTFPDPKDLGNEYATDEVLTQPNILYKHTPVDFINNSNILEFYVESPAAMHSVDHFANQSVTSYSKGSASFLYNLQSLNVDAFTANFNELFVAPFSSLFDKYQLTENFYKPQGKEQWTDSNGVLPAALNEAQFKNLKLTSLLYMNNNYIFKLPGNTWRQSMTFVDVTKRALLPDEQPSLWDLNSLGRHFVTCVKHVFTHDQYTNQIETVKPYRLLSGDINQSENVNSISIDQLLSP